MNTLDVEKAKKEVLALPVVLSRVVVDAHTCTVTFCGCPPADIGFITFLDAHGRPWQIQLSSPLIVNPAQDMTVTMSPFLIELSSNFELRPPLPPALTPAW